MNQRILIVEDNLGEDCSPKRGSPCRGKDFHCCQIAILGGTEVSVANRDPKCFEARDPFSYEPICGVHRIQLQRQELIASNKNPDALDT